MSEIGAAVHLGHLGALFLLQHKYDFNSEEYAKAALDAEVNLSPNEFPKVFLNDEAIGNFIKKMNEVDTHMRPHAFCRLINLLSKNSDEAVSAIMRKCCVLFADIDVEFIFCVSACLTFHNKTVISYLIRMFVKNYDDLIALHTRMNTLQDNMGLSHPDIAELVDYRKIVNSRLQLRAVLNIFGDQEDLIKLVFNRVNIPAVFAEKRDLLIFLKKLTDQQSGIFVSFIQNTLHGGDLAKLCLSFKTTSELSPLQAYFSQKLLNNMRIIILFT